MSPTHTHHAGLAAASSLDAREITDLAETYRRWRDVLAAAMAALHASGGPDVSPRLAQELRETLAANGAPVPATDLEDAAMALWLDAVASAAERTDATTELLREPWRTFNARRTADHLRLAG